MECDQLIALMAERWGLIQLQQRRTEIIAIAAEIMERYGLTEPGQLIQRIIHGDAAADELIQQVVVGETYFFRHPQQFELIRRLVLPQICAGSATLRPMSAWCAGCASGEEAYSLAILLEQEGLSEHVAVVGTDLSRAALDKARSGMYSRWSLRGADDQFIDRYFMRRAGQREEFQLVDHVRRRPVFEHDNLVAIPASEERGHFDLVMCRNVLIYFPPPTIAQVAQRLYSCLREGGWLITGPSDPSLSGLAPFEVIVTEAGLCYRRTAGRGSAPRTGAAPERRGTDKPRAPVMPNPAVGSSDEHLQRTVADAQQALAAGDYAGAIARTCDLDGSPEACGIHAQALVCAGDVVGAETVLIRASERHQLAAPLHFLLAILLVGQNRYDEALYAARRVVYLDRTMAAAHFVLATIERRRGSLRSAALSYRNARDAASMYPPDTILPLTEGQTAKQLMDAATSQLALVEQELHGK